MECIHPAGNPTRAGATRSDTNAGEPAAAPSAQEIPIDVAFGVYKFTSAEDTAAVIQAADAAMCDNKQGRVDG